MDNPISSSYQLLWKELKAIDVNSSVTIQNIMRRIIENYFKILGGYKDETIEKYQIVFKRIFEYTKHHEHYNMMMGIEEGSN